MQPGLTSVLRWSAEPSKPPKTMTFNTKDERRVLQLNQNCNLRSQRPLGAKLVLMSLRPGILLFELPRLSHDM